MTTDGLGGTGSLDSATTRELKAVVPAGGTASAWRFRVDGDVQPVTDGEGAVESDGVYRERVEENGDGTVTIHGSSTGSGADAFRYDGPIVAGEIDPQIELYRDGEATSLSALLSEKRLRVVAGDRLQSYSLTVGGDAARTGEAEPAPQDAITANGDGTTTISGETGNGYADTYAFSGELLSIDVPEEFTVYVDGREVNRTKELRVEAGPELRSYSVTVSGDASRESEAEPAPQDAITANDGGTTTISGATGNGYADTYAFSGELLYGDVPDEFAVSVDGDPITVRRELRVGTDPSLSLSSYQITVEGDAVKATKGSGRAESSDDVSENSDGTVTVSGLVGNGAADTFYITGRPIDADHPDGITTHLDGEAIDLVRGSDLFSDRVDRVVNVVEAGADPTGSERIDPVFGQEMNGAGNIGFYFPPYVDGRRAEYLLDGFAPTADNVELRSRDPGAVLVPPRRDYYATILEMRGNHSVIDGFVYDVTDAGFAPKIDLFAPNWQLSRFVVHGRADVSDYPEAMEAEDNGISVLRLAVTDPDGVGTLEDVYMDDGGAPPGERGNRRAVFLMANSAASHQGRVEARRCWFENWVENTWYGVYGNGSCLFEDCYVLNSPIGFRAAGGSVYRNCTFVKDDQVPWQRASLWGNADPGSNRTRGIWLNAGDDANPYASIEIVDCDFVFTDDTDFTMGQPIVVSHPTAKTRIANTRILLEQRTTDDGYSDGRHDRWPAFKLDDYSNAPSPAEFEFDGVHVVSDSRDAPAIVFDHEADVTAFDVEVTCPAGVTNLGEADVGAAWNVGDDPDRADPSPPIPEPPSYRIPKRSR